MTKNHSINISIILFFAMLAVSTSPVAAKLLNQSSQIDGTIIAFWRMFFAASILWIFSLFVKQGKFTNSKNLRRSILAGFFLGIHFALFFIALDLTKMANAAFLGTLTPVFTLILEIVFLKRKFNHWVYIGLACALIGAFVILWGAPFDSQNNDMVGNLCALGCSFILAISFLISEKVRQTEDTIVYTRTLYSSAAFILLIPLLILSKNFIPNIDEGMIYFGFFYLGLVPTIIGHNAFYYSLKYVKPTIIATVPLGEPIIASIIGYFLIPGELFTTHWEFTLIGGCVSLMGIFLVIRNKG
jgi:drug/metabolite transporter (DMT)-like permease